MASFLIFFSKQCLLECVNDNILINLDKKGTLTFSIEPSLHSSKEWEMNVKIIGSQELEPLNGSIGQTNVHVHATRIQQRKVKLILVVDSEYKDTVISTYTINEV